MLAKAQRGVAGLIEAMKQTEPDKRGGYIRRAMVIGIVDLDPDGCSSGDEEVELDFAAARKLIPLLLDTIGDELAALGAEQTEVVVPEEWSCDPVPP
jgi:hypothetical protein